MQQATAELRLPSTRPARNGVAVKPRNGPDDWPETRRQALAGVIRDVKAVGQDAGSSHTSLEFHPPTRPPLGGRETAG